MRFLSHLTERVLNRPGEESLCHHAGREAGVLPDWGDVNQRLKLLGYQTRKAILQITI